MKHFKIKSFISIVLLYCLFVVVFQAYTTRSARKELKKHTDIIADSVWLYDSKSSEKYLKETALKNHYERLVVKDSKGEKFIEVHILDIAAVEKFLTAVKVIPRIHMTHDIYKNDEKIGKIEIIWLNKSVYIYGYALIVCILIFAVIQLYGRLIEANLTLEKKVEQRTEDLEIEKRKLEKSEKKYRQLFEKSNDAIFIIETKTGKYLDANDAAMKLTGRNLQTLTSLSTFDICIEGAGERLNKIKSVHGTQNLGQVVYERPSGEKRYTHLSVIPLNDRSVIGIARDITEELEINDRLRQAQKMEAIGTLSGGIAHDFNNILSGIFGYSQLAQQVIEDPKKAKVHINGVIKGAKRAAELVQQILTFSRQTEFKKQAFCIYLEVNEALKLLRSTLPANIEIKKDLISKSKVIADPIRIHQVVMNLCTNAYHAMRKTGGTLTVSLNDIHIDKPRYSDNVTILPGDYILLEVSDTGTGMDKATLAKAFEPYFTTKKATQGTGLGLAMVQAIVEEHDGIMNVKTQPGKGTNFYIYFPVINPVMDNTRSDTRNEIHVNGNETIMIVDDEEPIRAIYAELLGSHGYSVCLFQNGSEALDSFKKDSSKFDLIITDLAMPGITGDKLSTEILKIKPDIPIVLCTGFSDNLTNDKIKKLGIKKFLQKPISNKNLIILVRQILDESS